MLTKSDFLQYLNCPESLWLKKNKPHKYPETELSDYDRKLSEDGYEVEELAQLLFPNAVKGIRMGDLQDYPQTKFFFQVGFTDGELYCRTDILERTENGKWNIYEVKASTSVKKEHLIDVSFQKYVLECCGFEVENVFLIHCNKDYIFNAEFIPDQFFKINFH